MLSYQDCIPSMDLKVFRDLCLRKPKPRGFSFPKAYVDYQKFMYLRVRFKDTGMACPNAHIDHVWHQHMLNPVVYHRDCMKWYGKLRDHDGTLGLTKAGKEVLAERIEVTLKLWESEFSSDSPMVHTKSTSKSASGKWHMIPSNYDGCG